MKYKIRVETEMLNKDTLQLKIKDELTQKRAEIMTIRYEQIDKAILQNIPKEILHRLYEDSCNEIKRRQNESILHK